MTLLSHRTFPYAANSSIMDLMQLQLEVCGQTKTVSLRSTADSGHWEGVDDLSCSGVCNQLKHFTIEVQIECNLLMNFPLSHVLICLIFILIDDAQ
jgi:hypothetical protein